MKRIYIVLVILVFFGCITLMQSKVNAADSEGNLIIILDPGHGGNDPGASNSDMGLKEADVTYKLAIYAKEELEKYEGVKVYLTRYSNCPLIYERGEFAKKYDADLMVSLHINAGSSSARGAEIWVTQDDTQIEYYEKCKELGEKILNEISKLGIKNNGVSTRSGRNNEWYESGVVKDYYGIIRYPMNYKIRSILVEHCFISNNSDCQYINTNEKIKNLAIADVRGIVQAYQLERKNQGRPAVKELKLDKTEMNLEITTDDPQPLNFINPVINPTNAYNKDVDFYSSNPNVARVWGERVRGLTQGETTVTAISRNNQRIAKCKIVVTRPEIPLKEITTNTTQQKVNVNETGDIIVNFNPINASDQTLYWESSKPDVVRIWNGHFRGLKEGKSEITATSRAGGKKISCTVIVNDPNKIHVETMNLQQEEYTAKVGEAVDIEYTYTPENAQNAEFYWISSNEEIIRVWGNRFRALKEGTAEVIATTIDETYEKRIPVIVKNNSILVEELISEKEQYTANVGEAVDIKYTYVPEEAQNAEFYWTSSNEEIIRVWGNRFRALKEGTAEVIAKTLDGTYEKRIQVTIKNNSISNVEELISEKEQYTASVGEAVDIKYTYAPEDAQNAEFYWTSSNEEIIRVWENRFRALKEGTAEVIAKTIDGTYEKRIPVIVKNNSILVEELISEKEQYIASVGEAVDIEYTYTPEDAQNAEFYWTSSNEEIIRVWGNRFRALKEGTAEVIAKTLDGTYEKRIRVTVE